MAAQSTIKGIVIDEEGSPLIGAAIHIKNTSKGILSDINGLFQIVADSSDVLIISYTGYVSVELSLDSSTFYKITLLSGLA